MVDPTIGNGLNVLLLGHSRRQEELYFWFRRREDGSSVWYANLFGGGYVSGAPENDVVGLATRRHIDLILIEPPWLVLKYSNDLADHGLRLATFTLTLRERAPEAIVAFFVEDQAFEELFAKCSPEVRIRLSHFYRLHRDPPGEFERTFRQIDEWWERSADPTSMTKLLTAVRDWQANYDGAKMRRRKFTYDVAISFAGEDRRDAEALAQVLCDAGLRVFYDDFETADLWGKDLFTKLHQVYSTEARYCIVLISKAYVQKQWTVHERRSAQERVLAERDNEYLLPVRLDDTDVPGLPRTVSYVDAAVGMRRVGELFIQKLATSLTGS